MTDAAFMLAVLQDGPATTMQIIGRSIAERGCGLTPHSRASDLRRQGHVVHCERVENGARPTYLYRLEVEPGHRLLRGAAPVSRLSASSPSTTTEPVTTRCAQKLGREPQATFEHDIDVSVVASTGEATSAPLSSRPVQPRLFA